MIPNYQPALQVRAFVNDDTEKPPPTTFCPDTGKTGKTARLSAPYPPPVTEIRTKMLDFRSEESNAFETVMMRSTPWAVQRNLAESLQNKTVKLQPQAPQTWEGHYRECLHLALCYMTGCGVQPDKELALQLLGKSVAGNETAKILYNRVATAFRPQSGTRGRELEHQTSIDMQLLKHSDQGDYFSHRFRMYRYTLPIQPDQIYRALSSTGLNQNDLSSALCIACQQGDLEAAMALSVQCKDFIHFPGEPTPLHWLVMFEEEAGRVLARALVLGSLEQRTGPCRNVLDAFSSSGTEWFFVPEHCLELCGTPLHWAVRTHNSSLVRVLIELGADINLRWGHATRTIVDLPDSAMSSLDIAVAFHLADIIDVLIELGAERFGGSSLNPHSAFHCIGLHLPPFLRYLIHGNRYRKALQDTINVLVSKGFHMHETTVDGYDPLLLALNDPDCEPYIVEELIAAGCSVGRHSLDHDSNAAVISARQCVSRPYNVGCLDLVASHVPDINHRDNQGRNALHYAAVANSAEAVRILSGIKGFDVNTRTSHGWHAIHMAAQWNSTHVIELLLDLGVEIDLPLTTDNDYHWTALAIAAQRRYKQAVDFLLERGANALFDDILERPLFPSVLSAACASASSEVSILSYLLNRHRMLHNVTFLDAADKIGSTALHNAAYFGDVDAVEALLEAQANLRLKNAFGETALALVQRLLRLRTEDGLAFGHDRIREKGPQGIANFKEQLREVERLLQMN